MAKMCAISQEMDLLDPLYRDDFYDETAAVELAAALELGRLDGALAYCDAATLRILAGRVARDSLIAALRQEGHDFTDQRFHIWFAGLATLSDTPPRHAGPPRALCEAILHEFAHSSWRELADLVPRLNAAIQAPQDLETHQAHARSQAVIAEARAVLKTLPVQLGPLPFAPLAALYQAMALNTRFAPAERLSTALSLGPQTVMIDRTAPASPRWAIEILFGEWLRQAGTLRLALPLPDLIRMDALAQQKSSERRSIRAHALRAAAHSLISKLEEAHGHARQAYRRLPGGRTTSRAPALFELLTGFGPLRSSQMERILGATRIGVRGMISSWDQVGAITRTTMSGSHLYTIVPRPTASPPLGDANRDRSFSTQTINDFEASLAHIDGLLACRSG